MPHRKVLSSPAVIDLLLDAVCVVNVQGEFVFVNAASEAIFGYTPAEMVGRKMIEMVAPEDRDRTLQAAQRVMAGETHLHFENCYLRKDGARVHIMWSARWSASDQFRVAVARDITARKRAESIQAATYAISEAAHAAADVPELLQHIRRALADLVPCRRFGVGLLDEGNGEVAFAYCPDPDAPHAPQPPAVDEDNADLAFCQAVIRGGQASPGTRLVGKARAALWPFGQANGQSSWLGMPLQSQSSVLGAVVLSRDASDTPYTEVDKELLQYVSTQVASAIERKRLYHRLQHLARFDALTDLPNRVCVEERIKTAIARHRRESRSLSLLYLDLDNFKQVNDNFGHTLGDLLLKEFARRLKACVREADTVGRMSGDEFVVLLESAAPQAADTDEVVTQKILAAFEAPFVLDGHTLHLRPSVGSAQYPLHGQDAAQLIRHADDAMYRMKNSRRQAAQAAPQKPPATPPAA